MRKLCLLFALMLLFPLLALAQQNDLTRLLRFPDVHTDKVVFVYAGDIWIQEGNNPNARKLTSHSGQELFPKFSPDGKLIAFSAEYSGTRQVYVMNVNGGEPKQLTFYNDVGPMPPRGGYDYQILDWTPDGKNVVFRGNRLPWGERMGKPFLIPVDGGMETAMGIPESGGGTLSPDGTKFAYTPIEREYRTWKRHRGGRAQDVWIYDLKSNTTEKITNHIGTDNQPIWIGDNIYYTSDKEHTLNLYAYNTKNKQTRKVTNHNDYDVLWPSSSDGQHIVYQLGGYVYKFDTKTEKTEQVAIKAIGDLPQTLPYYKNVRDFIDNFSLSPSGARAVITARGDIFTVPAKDGEIRNITLTPGIREMDAVWSPDGNWIAYLSDRSGEYEVYLRKSDGSGEEKRITTGGDIWTFAPIWSPDSKMLVFGDKKQRLRYVNIDTGKIVDADRSTNNDINTYTWSPDSKWIAYTKNADNTLSTIWLHSVAEGKNYQLTSGLTDDDFPVFDPKGRYLYFLSNRDINLTFSGLEFNYITTNPTRVYVGLLASDGPALLLPTSDEEKLSSEKPEKGEKADKSTEENKDKKKSEKTDIKIDIAGFESRVRAIPGSASNYRGLTTNDKGIFYLTGPNLKFYNIESKKEETILEGIAGYDISADGKKVIFRRGRDYGIVPAQAGQKPTDGLLGLDKLEMKIEPKAEWQQMYVDAWRVWRDWFYDPNMHGVDWKKMRDRYQVMVPFIGTRYDLDFILGELGGELNAGHVYVNSGDNPNVARREGGLLGAEIVAHSSGYFKIEKIFPGENWHENFRSPLTEPGIKVKTGDFILAVDGRSSKDVKNFYQLMENRGDRVVSLLVNDKPSLEGAREEKVRPVTEEGNLRYLDWIQSRREYVEKLSNGRIGYIHLPNTAMEGNRELFKNFFPQIHKEALIIDDRYNGGGFIPDRMIELLDRPKLNYWARRGVTPAGAPNASHDGPKAMLTNGYSSSGGDALPYYFRKRQLGKVIGTRTWGGLIGITANPQLVDNGSVSAPSFRIFSTDGQWVVENEGVSPDIEVLDRADLINKGQDPSLEKAVEVLLEELKKTPALRPKQPAYIDESK